MNLFPLRSRSTQWSKRDWSSVGYKLHITEVSDPDQAHFITQVETAPAIEQDHLVLAGIQQKLAHKDLLLPLISYAW